MKTIILAFFLSLISFQSYARECIAGSYAAFETKLSDPPYLICSNTCQFEVYNMSFSQSKKQWDLFSKMNGKTCAGNTNLEGGYDPTDPEPPKDTILKCTADYCKNPNNLQCPSGYATGSFNGSRICYKKNPNTDPNANEGEPDPEPDENGCVPEEAFPEKCTIHAINDAKNKIGNAINNASNSNSDSNGEINRNLENIVEQIRNLKIGTGTGSGNGNGEIDGPVDTSPFHVETPYVDMYDRQIDQNIFSSSPSCPPDSNLNMTFAGRSFGYSFSYEPICSAFNTLSFIIMTLAYCYAAYIVSKA